MPIHASRTALIAAAATFGLATAGQAAGLSDVPTTSWVSVTGEVVAMDEGEMRVDYGQGIVTAESASFGTQDGDSSARTARVGDDVTVTGWVDGGFFDDKTIAVASILNEDSGQVDYGLDAEDREIDLGFLTAASGGNADADASFGGYVRDIEGREFTLVTAEGRELRVDTSEMDGNPLDAAGIQSVAEGDRVSVAGELEDEVFESAELEAESITLLVDMNKRTP